MSKGLVTAVILSLALTGCGAGVAGDLPTDDISFKFDAKVAVNPTVPMPNQRVLLNLEVTSASTRAVKTDIYLTVLNQDGKAVYESLWEDVLFHENEVWNLTQGFLPDSDAKSSWTVKLRVHNKEANVPLLDRTIGTLDFGTR